MNFWDTSALVPLAIREVRTDEMLEILRGDPDMVFWWCSPLECASALWRRYREGALPLADLQQARADLAAWLGSAVEVTPADAVRRLAERLLAVHPLRSADALQLAAALAWSGEQPAGQGFICLDTRLRDAAAVEGFLVLPSMPA